MPKGPQGQKRPADAIGWVVARIATAEITEEFKEPSGEVQSGKAGENSREEKLAAGWRWGR